MTDLGTASPNSQSTPQGTQQSSQASGATGATGPAGTELGTTSPTPGATGATGATGAAQPKPNELLGAPPQGKYEAFKLPDGYLADEGAMTDFGRVAAEIGLSQAGAQRLVDVYAALQSKGAEAWNTQVKNWGTEAKADAEFGGANYDANLNIARGAIAKFGSDKLREQLEFSGFGNHPEFIRFAYKVGKALSEATATGGATPGAEQKDAASILFGGKT